MKKKLLKIVIIIGISITAMIGCDKKESTTATTEITETKVKETTVKNETDTQVTKSEEQDEVWTKLWPGQSMVINLDAKKDVIGSFIPDGNMMYRAANYNGQPDGNNVYCYFFSRYFEKEMETNKEFNFPKELGDVADDIWEHGMNFWKNYLGQANGPFLDSTTLSIKVESKEVVKLNGTEFLKEEVYAESAFMGLPKSTKFVAYYYQTEGGQGVCVFGDRSEELDKFDTVKEVAEAIMSTYRENTK